MRLTGGVKLTYGCIPGLAKAHLHVRAQHRDDFANMLLDLHTALAPRFTVIDGIIAMEGQGPGGGRPRELGSLFASKDAVALDAALADRTAHARAQVYTLVAAARRGLIDLERPYRLAGDPIVAEQSFEQAHRDLQTLLPSPLHRALRNLITARPRLVDEQACSLCGECETICGAGAIAANPTPVFDDALCVRCFCCTEVCPTGATDAVAPLPTRLIGRGR
jgi:ferredoxin